MSGPDVEHMISAGLSKRAIRHYTGKTVRADPVGKPDPRAIDLAKLILAERQERNDVGYRLLFDLVRLAEAGQSNQRNRP